MKGKSTKKRKALKIGLLALSFVLVIVVTASVTLAWFYDADWASKLVNMAGTVGIHIEEQTGENDDGSPIYATTQTGGGNLHFNITTDNQLAYPGQAIDASARVVNDGGRSGAKGSECYVRAHFAVYTNIGMDLIPDDGYDETISEGALNASEIYKFLLGLVNAQNSASSTHVWKYYQRTGATKISSTGVAGGTTQYWLDGTTYSTETEAAALTDAGYFYLCEKSSTGEKQLAKLGVNEGAIFLWNGTFIIPWTLTNYSAGKQIFILLTFQAIQTFIPVIDNNGIISGDANNQLIETSCTFDNPSVQTVFNSSNFRMNAIPKMAYVAPNGTIYYSVEDIPEEDQSTYESTYTIHNFSDSTKFGAFTTPENTSTEVATPSTSA